METFMLLPDYGRATAKQWMNILFGETVIGVIFLIWWALANPKNPPLILIFVVAVIIAGYFVWRADHVRLIPVLEIYKYQTQNIPVQDASLTSAILDLRTFVQVVPRCLTGAPIYECTGHLRELRRFNSLADRWEILPLAGLIFKWDNSEEQSITLHRAVEKPLNIVFVSHLHHQVVPCVFGDIPLAQIVDVFRKKDAGEIEAYEFDIQVTCSDAVNGASLKPVRVCLGLQVTYVGGPNLNLDLKQVEVEK